MGDLLAQTRARIKASKDQGQTPVVIFDLDGTVYDNSPRTWNILARFADEHGRDDLRRAMVDLPPTRLPYLLGDTLKSIGFDDEELTKAAVGYWKDRFFTDDIQAHDVALPGAVAFVNRCYDDGATVVYLTGRDVPGMGVGCFHSLRSHNLPVGLVRTTMVLKHDFETTDLDFKTEAVEYIDSLGHVVASFDNEPGNCNLFLNRWPDALIALCDTQHAPGAPELADGVIRFFDFLA